MTEKTLYKLSHHYDTLDTAVYFKCGKLKTLPVELAVYLQFKAESFLDESISLSNTTIAAFLNQLGAEIIDLELAADNDADCHKIDMYFDREARCGEWYEKIYPVIDSEDGFKARAFLESDEETLAQVKAIRKPFELYD